MVSDNITTATQSEVQHTIACVATEAEPNRARIRCRLVRTTPARDSIEHVTKKRMKEHASLRQQRANEYMIRTRVLVVTVSVIVADNDSAHITSRAERSQQAWHSKCH